MSDYEDLMRNYATHAEQALAPVIREAAAQLGIEDEHAMLEVLGEAMARAYMAGVDAGQSEVMAQAAEQGFNVNLTHLRAPDSD